MPHWTHWKADATSHFAHVVFSKGFNYRNLQCAQIPGLVDVMHPRYRCIRTGVHHRFCFCCCCLTREHSNAKQTNKLLASQHAGRLLRFHGVSRTHNVLHKLYHITSPAPCSTVQRCDIALRQRFPQTRLVGRELFRPFRGCKGRLQRFISNCNRYALHCVANTFRQARYAYVLVPTAGTFHLLVL